MRTVQLAASILAGDWYRLGDQIESLTAADPPLDRIHVDVMDGQFVPRIGGGVEVVRSLTEHTALPVDVHLMTVNPLRWVDAYLAAGAAQIAVHLEGLDSRIRLDPSRLAVAVSPQTPIDRLTPYARAGHTLLVLTAPPGRVGAAFDEHALARLSDVSKSTAPVIADGAIDVETVGPVVAAGADVVVVGRALLEAPDPAAALVELRAAASIGQQHDLA